MLKAIADRWARFAASAAGGEVRAVAPPDLATDYAKRLWEEYKLAQGKMDKIGEFQFKVKGWAVTLLGAVLFGGIATSHLTSALAAAIVIAALFHAVETRQRWFTRRLSRRAITIERTFRSALVAGGVFGEEIALRLGPAVGRMMTDEGSDAASLNIFGRVVTWFVRTSNDTFYWVQYVLLGLVLVTHVWRSHVTTLGWKDDPRPRYELSVGPYELIVYRRTR